MENQRTDLKNAMGITKKQQLGAFALTGDIHGGLSGTAINDGPGLRPSVRGPDRGLSCPAEANNTSGGGIGSAEKTALRSGNDEDIQCRQDGERPESIASRLSRKNGNFNAGGQRLGRKAGTLNAIRRIIERVTKKHKKQREKEEIKRSLEELEKAHDELDETMTGFINKDAK